MSQILLEIAEQSDIITEDIKIDFFDNSFRLRFLVKKKNKESQLIFKPNKPKEIFSKDYDLFIESYDTLNSDQDYKENVELSDPSSNDKDVKLFEFSSDEEDILKDNQIFTAPT
ncbi:408_t:CDS:1 [Racocetra persica]|uniref:408_t:CDS:1 n=1 Tax=Racocetra persica TaxID=160502 RepID=A0ACA9KJX4_9GLOM|nr:408_t:CDS:1 [Racocetra persica]